MMFGKALTLAALGAALVLGTGAQAQSQRSVKIATEGAYAPYNFTLPNGKLDGFEVELAADLCRRMNARCEVVAQDWDGIIPALNAGKYDAIMAGMNITDKRLEVLSFSRPYAATPHGFGVMKDSPLAKLAGTGSSINIPTATEEAKKTIEAWKPLLKGKTIGVQGSTSNSAFLEKYLKDTVTIREYKTTEQHDLDLSAGRLDAVFAGHAALVGTMEKPEFKDMMIAGAGMLGDVLGRGVAVAMRKQDDELRGLMDKAIGEAAADGTLQRLSKKWFKIDAKPQA